MLRRLTKDGSRWNVVKIYGTFFDFSHHQLILNYKKNLENSRYFTFFFSKFSSLAKTQIVSTRLSGSHTRITDLSFSTFFCSLPIFSVDTNSSNKKISERFEAWIPLEAHQHLLETDYVRYHWRRTRKNLGKILYQHLYHK